MASKELANTLGAVLIGTLASFFLCGVVVTSVTSYVKAFPNDRWYLKLVVFVSLILSLADTAVDGELSYRWMVTNFGQVEVLEVLPKEFVAMLAILGFVPFVVQLFFAWRLWKISTGFVSPKYNWILPTVIASLSAAQLGVVLSNVVVWENTPLLADMATSIFPRAYAWIACLTVADLLISFSMMYYLVVVPRRDLDVPAQSQSRFMAIARRCVETNTLTLVVQIILVVLETTGTTGLWYILLDKITVKNYLFALISSLNARQSGQGLGSSGGVAMGRLTSTKMRRTGDVNVTIVQDVFVDSHELAVGSVPMDDYYRPSRGPVNLQFPGGTARSDEHEGKGWGTAESV